MMVERRDDMKRRDDMTVPIICPGCGEQAQMQDTRYGRRDSCERCGLRSWHGKPLVSDEIHKARNACHAIFDPLWQTAHEHYKIEETPGTKEYTTAINRINKAARGRAYKFIAFTSGMPEPECHMAEQQDIEKLRTIWKAANGVTFEQVRKWWKDEGGEQWWIAQHPQKEKEVA